MNEVFEGLRTEDMIEDLMQIVGSAKANEVAKELASEEPEPIHVYGKGYGPTVTYKPTMALLLWAGGHVWWNLVHQNEIPEWARRMRGSWDSVWSQL